MQNREYNKILLPTITAKQLTELKEHLSMNGYGAGFDESGNMMTVHECEYYEVQTILEDRGIDFYDVAFWSEDVTSEQSKVTLTYDYDFNDQGKILNAKTFSVDGWWLRHLWDTTPKMPTEVEEFSFWLEAFDPKTDGKLVYDQAVKEGAIFIDGPSITWR
jgi:hypothetical protein